MAKRVAKPTRISEVLAKYLRRAGLNKRLAQAGVVEAWPDLVGERLAGQAQALNVRADGVLLVRVRSAGWAQELSLMTPDIIARVNAGRKDGRIEGIRWVVGRD
jgi:predicted nucleic acid-binding Zn ribbon protein